MFSWFKFRRGHLIVYKRRIQRRQAEGTSAGMRETSVFRKEHRVRFDAAIPCNLLLALPCLTYLHVQHRTEYQER